MIKSKEEIEFLKDWINEINEFILRNEISEKTMEIGTWFIKESKRAIEEAYRNQNIRGLRCAFHDTNEMAYAMKQDNVNRLNRVLKSKFGFDLNSQNKKDLVKIKAIVDRGCIKNNGEYYLIKGRIDALNGMDGHEDEMDRLDRLMTDYELRKRNNVKY